MKNQKNSHELIRQNEQIVKKSQKHEANLQKNSSLYFQIGLIVCLLAAFGLLEMNFETTIPKVAEVLPPDEPIEISIENFKVYEEPKTEVQPEVEVKKKVILTDKVKEVDNDFKLEKALEIVTSEQNTSSEPTIDPGKVLVLDKPDEPMFIGSVQKVPIYPGCERAKNNPERKKCMSEKIGKLIQRKFDGNEIASYYGLTGKQRINVQFTIDKTGHVTDIKTKAPHPKLQDEAVRVINFIPEMTPGKQNNKDVGVIYTLPIIIEVQ